MKLQYKVIEAPIVLDTYTAADVATAIVHDFDVRKRMIDDVITFIKRGLSFIFIRIILDAQNYHEKYLTDIEFDNIYVSMYFRRIDLRRKLRGSMSILPLKKVEGLKFVDPYGIKQSKMERRNLIGQMMKLILELLTVTSFVLLDRLFYETLHLIRRHARLDYRQVNYHARSHSNDSLYKKREGNIFISSSRLLFQTVGFRIDDFSRS